MERSIVKEMDKKIRVNDIEYELIKNYKDGDKVGISYIYLDETLIKEEPIYAKKEKIKKQKNIFDIIRSWFK